MAITPLTSPYKSLTFAGQTSASFGVQILGEGTFNAPVRAVDMVTVPGRSGAIAIDRGYYENIEVRYKANLIAGSAADFADGISAFRNFLCSQKGYCRLSDDYNPNEYRMAVYKSGLEASVKALRAGEFDLVFDCKPQRFLTSGETEQTIAASGDTLTNPTQYASSPLLAVKGYGHVGFNGYGVDIPNASMGTVVVNDAATVEAQIRHGNSPIARYYLYSRNIKYNTGNTLTYGKVTAIAKCRAYNKSGTNPVTGVAALTSNCSVSYELTSGGNAIYTVVFAIDGGDAVSGTTTTVNTQTATIRVTHSSSTSDITLTFTLESSSVSGGRQQMYITLVPSSDMFESASFSYGAVTANSSISVAGDPTYIDCDLGECYKYLSDELVSLNGYISLSSDLPELASGSNTITYDNTVTELKITPRWWKL